jgi:hypothetical protein
VVPQVMTVFSPLYEGQQQQWLGVIYSHGSAALRTPGCCGLSLRDRSQGCPSRGCKNAGPSPMEGAEDDEKGPPVTEAHLEAHPLEDSGAQEEQP